MESVLQRLGFLVDTSGLMRGQAAIDSTTAAGIRLGQASDVASAKLSTMGRGPVQANLRGVALEMDRAAASSRAFNANAEQVNTRLTMMGTAAMTVAGVLAFQLVGAIASVASELASIPLESAKAADALTRFNSQLMFAFKGSADSVRQARADIMALARDAGVPISQLRGDYADIAISGRAAGLTRTQVSDVVGAFAQLGQLSGADPGALSRSMYQYQQMLNVGQVRWSDFKLADLNLPAFGDAVAEGLGVSSSELTGMISRGELSAYRLTEALAEGVPRLLEQAGGELPQLMSRSQAAMETEWTRLLENMGQAWRTSEFIQSLQYGLADLIGWAANGGRSETPQEELARLRQELAASGPTLSDLRNTNRGGPDITSARLAQVRARKAELERTVAADLASAERARADEEEQARAARQRNAMGIVTNLDPIRAAQAQARADLALVQDALADTTGLTSEQVSELRRGLSLLEGQISRIESAVDRARRQQRESAADLARFGPGGGFDLARSARGLVEQSISQMRPISLEQAMAIVRGEWLTGAANDLGETANDNERRRMELAAAGLGTDARRRADLDVQERAFRARFGRVEDMSPDQAAAVDALAGQNRAQMSERYELEDRRRYAERNRAEQERVQAMQAQLSLAVRLGQEGRIALAQLQAEHALRIEVGDILADELLPAERARVAESIRLNEQLALHVEHLARLQDSAETVGRTIGDVLGASISEGVEKGRIDGEAALDVLGRSASRILNNLVNNMTAPWERRITEMAGGWFERMGGPEGAKGAEDEAVRALGAAATEAARGLAHEMVPSAAEAAAKIAISTTATQSEAATKLAATAMTNNFTGALTVATMALKAFTAAAAQESGADFASAIAASFTGGGGTKVPGFAKGVRGFAGGWAIVGEEGPELVNLPRGANVFSHAESKGMMDGSGVAIIINDQRGANAAPVERRESRGPNGERQVELFIKDQMVKNAGDGDFAAAMGARYGTRPLLKKS